MNSQRVDNRVWIMDKTSGLHILLVLASLQLVLLHFQLKVLYTNKDM
jgi:hypothetical protein